METLDEAASAQEKLDLEFADGLKMIAQYVDNGGTSTSSSPTQLVDATNQTGKSIICDFL